MARRLLRDYSGIQAEALPVEQAQLATGRCMWLSTSACAQGQQHQQSAREQARAQQQSLVKGREQFDEITDKHIPVRPLGVVEGTSYSLVIAAGLACCGAIVYTAVNSLLVQPKQYTVFNMALEKLRHDPRVTVRLGTPISGYGQESTNRAARQMIPHRIYNDNDGKEHVQVQFRARGPTGSGLVGADMFKDSNKKWQYSFLFIDLDAPLQHRLHLEGPGP